MKKIFVYLLFVVSLFSVDLYAYTTNYYLDETIRKKVEDIQLTQKLNNAYPVYCNKLVNEAYLHHNFEPYWEDNSNASDLLSALRNSFVDGLNPDDYHLQEIEKLISQENGNDKANLDILLTDAFILYLSHLSSGKINPETIDAQWHIPEDAQNPLTFFYLADSEDIGDIVALAMPQNNSYQLLKEELAYYRTLAEKQQPEPIPSGEKIKPGMSDNRISLIRKTLNFLNDNEVVDSLLLNTYDNNLKAEIIAFQKHYGLEALGNIGAQTIEALNTPVLNRIATIEANMERLRWLPRKQSNFCIMVNIANFELQVKRDGQIVQKHKVVVGKPYRMTPVFTATMQYLVLNSTWTVPPTILKKDIIPEIRKDRQTLTRKNIKVYDNSGNLIDTSKVDWTSHDVFSYTYRQDAGATNALGAVKFMFPNSYDVYLHDTPSKELFNQTDRAFSSGCIRVQKPLELAEYLLNDADKYSLEQLNKIIATGATQTVLLKEKPQVFLLYFTSWVDEDGTVNFRKDIYNRDAALIKALKQSPTSNEN